MKVATLGDLSETIDYGVTASADSRPVGPKFLRITDIQDGAVDWSSVPYCQAEKEKLASARLARGDIVFARTGATTGKSFLIQNCPEDAVFASYLIRVRPSHDVDPAYLAHFFDSQDYWRQISLKAAGAAQPGVNASKLKELQVPLPPLAEQKRIAAILDQADALRRLRRRALDRLNTLGQAIFQEMFGDPEANPMSWPKRPLGEVGRLDRGVSKHRPRNDPALLGGSHPLIQTGDVSKANDYIVEFGSTYSDLGLKQSRKWPAGTLCITIAANIADTALLGFDACFPDSVVGFDSGDEALNFFVHRWFATVRGKLDRIAPAVAQKNINLAILRDLPVIVPDREHLQRYYERESALRRVAQRFHSSKQATETALSSLQHRAFTGQL